MTVRVAAVGDIHVGVDSTGLFRPRIEAVSDHADLLLFAGDYTAWGAASEAAVLAHDLRDVDIAMFGVLGNHDYQSDENKQIVDVLGEAGLKILECDSATVEINGVSVGIAGAKGFMGGFEGASGANFGEPEMKAFIRHTEEIAERFGEALGSLDTDIKIALLHYAPVPDTVVGEKPEISAWLGSYLLCEPIDAAGPDIVIHGHAHAGTFEGRTPGGIPVYNVAEQVIAKPYHVFQL